MQPLLALKTRHLSCQLKFVHDFSDLATNEFQRDRLQKMLRAGTNFIKSFYTCNFRNKLLFVPVRPFQPNLFAVNNGTACFKKLNNCFKSNIYSYLETSVGQSSNLCLNVVHFFNTSVNYMVKWQGLLVQSDISANKYKFATLMQMGNTLETYRTHR